MVLNNTYTDTIDAHENPYSATFRRVTIALICGAVCFFGTSSNADTFTAQMLCKQRQDVESLFGNKNFEIGRTRIENNERWITDNWPGNEDTWRLDQLLEYENYRWLVAQLPLRVAESHASPEEWIPFASYAEFSAEMWSDYINWYRSLSSSCRDMIKNHRRGGSRIIAAVAFLGNAWSRASRPNDLFSSCQAMESEYLGKDIMDLWLDWLWKGPNLENPKNRSFIALVERVGEAGYKQYWEAYSTALNEWLKNAWLTNADRTYYQDIAAAIDAAVERVERSQNTT